MSENCFQIYNNTLKYNDEYQGINSEFTKRQIIDMMNYINTDSVYVRVSVSEAYELLPAQQLRDDMIITFNKIEDNFEYHGYDVRFSERRKNIHTTIEIVGNNILNKIRNKTYDMVKNKISSEMIEHLTVQKMNKLGFF